MAMVVTCCYGQSGSYPGVLPGSGPGTQSARLLLIAVPGGTEDYFRQINNAPDDGERHRIGELYDIRVVPE